MGAFPCARAIIMILIIAAAKSFAIIDERPANAQPCSIRAKILLAAAKGARIIGEASAGGESPAQAWRSYERLSQVEERKDSEAERCTQQDGHNSLRQVGS